MNTLNNTTAMPSVPECMVCFHITHTGLLYNGLGEITGFQIGRTVTDVRPCTDKTHWNQSSWIEFFVDRITDPYSEWRLYQDLEDEE